MSIKEKRKSSTYLCPLVFLFFLNITPPKRIFKSVKNKENQLESGEWESLVFSWMGELT